MKPRILVVEDDFSVVQSLIGGLTKAGFEVAVAMDGEAGLQQALAEPPDLIVLDLMLPERDGFSVLEALHGRSSVPVVVLSARTELPSRLRSFSEGAVDFVPKPFFMEELVARIKMRLSLLDSGPRRLITLSDIEVDLDARQALREGHPVELTAHEFNVLVCLLEREGRALSRAQIGELALPEGSSRTDRTVDSHVSRIRKKLGAEAARHLQTVWGIGYRYRKDL